MNINKNYIKKKILINNPIGKPINVADNYINIFLTRTTEVFEYVDVKRDERVYTIDRQMINPYFINFGFFNTINRIKVANKNQLSLEMIANLRKNYGKEIIIDTLSITDVFILSDNTTKNILTDRIGITIAPTDRNVVFPATKKFRIVGTSNYNGVYMLSDFNESLLKDDNEGYKCFLVKPIKKITNGTSSTIDLPTETGDVITVPIIKKTLPGSPKIQIIKDNFESFEQESFDDKNWDVKAWFERVGMNTMLLAETVTVDDYTKEKTTVNGLEELEYDLKTTLSVISKSYHFPIKVNK